MSGLATATPALRRAIPRRRSVLRVRLGLVALVVIALAGRASQALRRADAGPFGGQPFTAPRPGHVLGTDETGADVLALVGAGVERTLASAALAAGAALVVGIVAAAVLAMLLRRCAESVGSRSRPLADGLRFGGALVLCVVLRPHATAVGGPANLTSLLLGVCIAPGVARRLGAAARDALAAPLAERLRAAGASDQQILRRHGRALIGSVVATTFAAAAATAAIWETALAALGLGDPARRTLGALLNAAQVAGADAQGAWWDYLPAAAAATLVVAALVSLATPRSRA